MNTKHTPGPWTHDETWGLITADNGKTEIAACHAGRGADSKANARLIASAPVLLGILEGIVDPRVRAQMSEDDWSQVRACIAKAKGGGK